MLAFVIYHLLHFTVRVTNPEIYVPLGGHGMVDVYFMVVNGFKSVLPVIVYLAGMIFLFLHVSHGFQSLFQTLGLSNDKSLPAFWGTSPFLCRSFSAASSFRRSI
jgi:succinate dehydrogenase / fumarate reductase cytochrome b subunit